MRVDFRCTVWSVLSLALLPISVSNAEPLSAENIISATLVNGNTTLLVTNGPAKKLKVSASGSVPSVEGATSESQPIDRGDIQFRTVTVDTSLRAPQPFGFVVGAGKLVTQRYKIRGAVAALDIAAAGNISIVQGSTPEITVTVTTYQNLQNLLSPQLKKSGDLQVLADHYSFSAKVAPKVVITLPTIPKIRAFNGGIVSVRASDADRLALLASNGVSVRADGVYHSARIDASDGAAVSMVTATVDDADIRTSAGAKFTGKVQGTVKVRASNGAAVSVTGHPRVLSAQNYEGSSVVIQ